jgi:hypothetical protein
MFLLPPFKNVDFYCLFYIYYMTKYLYKLSEDDDRPKKKKEEFSKSFMEKIKEVLS